MKEFGDLYFAIQGNPIDFVNDKKHNKLFDVSSKKKIIDISHTGIFYHIQPVNNEEMGKGKKNNHI